MRTGCVHGRFQPFHKEHMQYFHAALEQCDFLWIGITKYELFKAGEFEADKGRNSLLSNPLTYIERANIIRDALMEEGVDRARFGFVPFPIDTPELLPQFVNLSTICFTTIREEWNKEKIESLKALGYEVVVVREELGEKAISSTLIRNSIVAGDGLWEDMVFESTRAHVAALDLKGRLCKAQG